MLNLCLRITPLQEGYLRCATVQSEVMLAKLLSEGIYKPTSAELKLHGMAADCSACEDGDQWCWSDAHAWMYGQCAKNYLSHHDSNSSSSSSSSSHSVSSPSAIRRVAKNRNPTQTTPSSPIPSGIID